jgi:hypothetical protein
MNILGWRKTTNPASDYVNFFPGLGKLQNYLLLVAEYTVRFVH